MKKYILLITISLSYITICNAQVEIGKLEKARDYLNSKMTYYLLQEFIKSEPNSQPNFDIIQPSLANCSIDNAPNFSSIHDLLKGKFDKAIQKLSAPINSIKLEAYTTLSNEAATKAIIDSAFNILHKNYGDKFNSLEVNRDLLTKTISPFLIAKIPPQQIDSNNKVDNTVVTNNNASGAPLTEVDDKGFFSFSNFNFWVLLPLLLCAIIFILMLRLFSKFDERMDKRKEEIEALSNRGYNSNNSSSSSSSNFNSQFNAKAIEKMIRDSDKIGDLNMAISRLQEQISRIEGAGGSGSSFQHSYQQPPKQEPVTNDIFYMAGPVSNYFPNTAKSLTKENTVYKFTLKGNKQEATYEIHTAGAPVNEIISMVESYIKPACDEENLPSFNVKNIITKRPGIAILEGDKWTIKTKALIRYE